MMYGYKLKFYYRETQGSEPVTERFIIQSHEKNANNAGEIEMLKFLTRHGYYSGKVISCEPITGNKY